jgi:hypothetical protein
MFQFMLFNHLFEAGLQTLWDLSIYVFSVWQRTRKESLQKFLIFAASMTLCLFDVRLVNE